MEFAGLIDNLLCPPGSGVFTVHTASDLKEELGLSLYESKDPRAVEKKWKEGLKELKNKNLKLLGLASDCGGGIQRGANWGPLYIRNSLYQDRSMKEDLLDLGDIRIIPHLLHDKYLNNETIEKCREALYNEEGVSNKLPVSPLSQAELLLDNLYQNFPESKVITLGGDHSCSYPAVKSYLRHKKNQGIKVALIHFDAHTDLLTERLGIDICFGSWCTHILDDLPSPDHLIQLGIRSSGKERNHWEKNFGVQQIWSDTIKNKKRSLIAKEITDFLHKNKVQELYVSFDIDALDESIAGATGTPEAGGITVDHALQILYPISAEFQITGADLMEVAPHVRIPSQIVKVNPEPDSTLLAANSLMTFFVENMK